MIVPQPDGRRWRLGEPLQYKSAIGSVITVPQSFVTDLASIPKLFWNILPPFGKYTAAAVVHDWLYRTHRIPRAGADAILLEAMEVCRVPRWQCMVIYLAVRIFGGFAWRNENRHIMRRPYSARYD